MNARIIFAIAAVCLCITGTVSAQYTASLTLTCKEIRFGKGSSSNSTLCVMFKTSSGAAAAAARSRPQREEPPNGEFRPDNSTPGTYTADYLVIDSSQARVVERGSIAILLPTEDLDGNSLPDLLQPGFATDILFEGRVTPDYFEGETPFTKPVISGTMVRDFFAGVGSYSLDILSGDNSALAGSFEIQEWTGALSYRRYPKPMKNWALVSLAFNAFGEFVSMFGNTTFEAAPEQLVLKRLVIRPNGFRTLTETTLQRSGDRYMGELQMTDGCRTTKSADFADWALTVIDNIDSDGDGVSDIADDFAPVILAQPAPVTAKIGGTASFRVKALGDPPLTFQWQMNGVDILAQRMSFSA